MKIDRSGVSGSTVWCVSIVGVSGSIIYMSGSTVWCQASSALRQMSQIVPEDTDVWLFVLHKINPTLYTKTPVVWALFEVHIEESARPTRNHGGDKVPPSLCICVPHPNSLSLIWTELLESLLYALSDVNKSLFVYICLQHEMFSHHSRKYSVILMCAAFSLEVRLEIRLLTNIPNRMLLRF
jgi:hypothetical protein